MAEHSHVCRPRGRGGKLGGHGEYVCPWSICSVQRGLKPPWTHCQRCILAAEGRSEAEHAKRAGVKEAQQTNKREYRKKLEARPTNAVAMGKAVTNGKQKQKAGPTLAIRGARKKAR